MGARVLRLLIFVYVLLRSALFSANSEEPNEMSAKRRSKERKNKITQRKRDHSIYLHIIDRGQILGNWMLFCVFCPFGQEKRQHTQPQWTSEKKRKHIASHHTERKTNSYVSERRICCAKHSNPFIYLFGRSVSFDLIEGSLASALSRSRTTVRSVCYPFDFLFMCCWIFAYWILRRDLCVSMCVVVSVGLQLPLICRLMADLVRTVKRGRRWWS